MERIILEPMDFNKLKNQVKNNKGKEIIFQSGDDEFNRKVMEKLPVNGVMIDLDERRDYMKQRNSGFNEVMARIAKKKGLNIYVDFDSILNSKNKERLIARLKQNIDLCNREKIQIKVFMNKSKRDDYEVKSFFASLGAPTWMIAGVNACSNL